MHPEDAHDTKDTSLCNSHKHFTSGRERLEKILVSAQITLAGEMSLYPHFLLSVHTESNAFCKFDKKVLAVWIFVTCF